jgi:hypothetical protein
MNSRSSGYFRIANIQGGHTFLHRHLEVSMSICITFHANLHTLWRRNQQQFFRESLDRSRVGSSKLGGAQAVVGKQPITSVCQC